MNLTDHLQDLKEVVGGSIITKSTRDRLLETTAILRKAKLKGIPVYTFGNGGSHANASHFACDLLKACGVKAICISDMIPSAYAYMNDDGVRNMFSQILNAFDDQPNVIVAFSCSGNSENVIEAMGSRNPIVDSVVLFTGEDGGDAKDFADVVIKVNHPNIRIQESAHSVYCHAIVEDLLNGA